MGDASRGNFAKADDAASREAMHIAAFDREISEQDPAWAVPTRAMLRRYVEAVTGDITTQTTDAIVNAANATLLGGGGVDGAIHAAAGPRLLEACRRVRRTTWPDGLPVGEAVATEAFDLPARWVIHTVGPNAHRGQTDPAMLASCFTRCLDVAAELGATSSALPAS